MRRGREVNEEHYGCKRVKVIDVSGKTKKGRPERIWMDNIKHDLTKKGLSIEEQPDRAE